MSYNLLWMFLLILQSFTESFPVPNQDDLGVVGIDRGPMNNSPKILRYEGKRPATSDEKVISVRITSSVAIGRGRGKPIQAYTSDITEPDMKNASPKVYPIDGPPPTIMSKIDETELTLATDVPPNLIGANIEYLKQLNAKKESKDLSADPDSFDLMVKEHNDNDDELPTKINEYEENISDVPLARKVPSTADVNRFQVEKTIQRYQNPELNRPEAYDQNRQMNNSRDSLYEPHIKFVTKKNNNSKNIENENITTLPIVDLQNDNKEIRDLDSLTRITTFAADGKKYQSDDSIAEPSIKSVEFAKYSDAIEDIPPTVPVHPSNNGQEFTNRPLNEGRNNPRLTTVSFNIVHDNPKTSNDNEPSSSYISSSQVISNQKPFYDPPKIYSQPAQIYSEPAKFYSEPAKIYSEPAKIYSEPAKVYSEPAKIYSEPSKFYSEPASLHLTQNVPSIMAPNYSSPWRRQPPRPFGSTTMNTTPTSTVTNAFPLEHQPEKNYEIDEKISVLTDGRSHGVQDPNTEKCKQDKCKVGYVLEGRQFKKYRVEERTPDGFIVGEYGVVRNEDGALRGVRYTADSDASPGLIHDALMKFLQLT